MGKFVPPQWRNTDGMEHTRTHEHAFEFIVFNGSAIYTGAIHQIIWMEWKFYMVSGDHDGDCWTFELAPDTANLFLVSEYGQG